VGLCDTVPVDLSCNSLIWPYRIYSNFSISPHAFLYKYRAYSGWCLHQHHTFCIFPYMQMDRGSRISRSSDSSGGSSSSNGSFMPLPKPNDDEAFGEVTSPTPQDLWVELSRLKVALASHEHMLVERSNHLSRLVGEVDSKDHQLALANRQIQL
jgi:hypothetical protein